MAIDGKRWSAERNRIGIAARQWKDLVVERSQGRHTLQWFRILMIKVARCMLAAYHEKKSGDAFDRLNRAIGEVGRLYPTWSAKTEVWPKPGESCLRVGGKIVPIENWPSRDWDFTQQASVAALPSRSRKGVVKIFGSFVKAILAEERRQNKAAENDLITAEKRAREIQQISKGHFAKPPRR
jgi:hypothetical protein